MKKISKGQKRVRQSKTRSKKSKAANGNAKRNIRAKALHLLLGNEHFHDRAQAEKLRMFPFVPRKQQAAFPDDVKIGFSGHYRQDGKFEIQNRKQFITAFEANVENAYYMRIDKRPRRKPRREDTGLLETNAAISTGPARVLADLVRAGRHDFVRNTLRLASEAGMAVLSERSGYLPAYLAVHPDAEGTVSTHFGAWPVDPERHVLIGRSATGTPGRKGLRNLGKCFTSILRHDRAIGLPNEVTARPRKNRDERDTDDWALGEEMDRVVRAEISKLPNGPKLLTLADEYQREAAEDWFRRFRQCKPGVDSQYAELEAARKKIAELEEIVSRQNETDRAEKKRIAELEVIVPPQIEPNRAKKKRLSLRQGILGVLKLAGVLGGLCKGIGMFVVKLNRSLPRIEIILPRFLMTAGSNAGADSSKRTVHDVRKSNVASDLTDAMAKSHQHPAIKHKTIKKSDPVQAPGSVRGSDEYQPAIRKSKVQRTPMQPPEDDDGMSMGA